MWSGGLCDFAKKAPRPTTETAQGSRRRNPIGRRAGSDAPPHGRRSSMPFHEAQEKGSDDPCSGRRMSTVAHCSLCKSETGPAIGPSYYGTLPALRFSARSHAAPIQGKNAGGPLFSLPSLPYFPFPFSRPKVKPPEYVLYRRISKTFLSFAYSAVFLIFTGARRQRKDNFGHPDCTLNFFFIAPAG